MSRWRKRGTRKQREQQMPITYAQFLAFNIWTTLTREEDEEKVVEGVSANAAEGVMANDIGTIFYYYYYYDYYDYYYYYYCYYYYYYYYYY